MTRPYVCTSHPLISTNDEKVHSNGANTYMELLFLTTHRLPTDFTKGRLDHLRKLSAPLRGMPAEGVLVPMIIEGVHHQLLNLARPSKPRD